MISSKTLIALLGVALVMLAGCRGQEPEDAGRVQ